MTKADAYVLKLETKLAELEAENAQLRIALESRNTQIKILLASTSTSTSTKSKA